MSCKNGSGFGSLLGIFLPFYVSSPTGIFFCKRSFCFFFNPSRLFVGVVALCLRDGFCFVFDRLIEEGQFHWGKTLLELPLIYSLKVQLISYEFLLRLKEAYLDSIINCSVHVCVAESLGGLARVNNCLQLLAECNLEATVIDI